MNVLQNRKRMAHDGQTGRGDPDIHGAAFKQLHAQFFFEVSDRHRQGGLGHATGAGRSAKVLFPGQGNHIFERCQIH